MSENWLALIIGNTRLHWGWFHGSQFIGDWHTPQIASAQVNLLKSAGFQAKAWQSIAGITSQSPLPQPPLFPHSLWIASVVPEQTALWRSPAVLMLSGLAPISVQVVMRSHISLSGIYPTLGIDRIINLLGAGNTLGWPVLVIDGGSALTFTAGTFTAGTEGSVYGGAILPGLRLQQEALSQGTAIPNAQIDDPTAHLLPKRWATDTVGAIASGVVYGVIAAITDYLTDWWHQFPTGKAVLTGGDAPLFYAGLQQRTPEIASKVQVDSQLMFQGMLAYRQSIPSISS